MKKIISLLVSLTLILSIVPMTVMADGTGWDGVTATACTNGDGLSADTAYEISTPEELAWARDAVNAGTANSAYFELTADIDLNNQEWVPIGTATNAFTGKFVGNGHVVKNMKITVDATVSGNKFPRGFFGNVGTNTAGAQITNLGVDNITILVNGNGEYGPSDMGGFAGLIQGGNTKISGCYVKNSSVRALYTTAAVGSVGGFAGQVGNNTTVENCYVYNTKILGGKRTYQGGFVGVMKGGWSTTLKNCYADVALDKTGYVNWSGTEAVYGFACWTAAPDAATAGYTVKFTDCYSTLDDAEKDEKAAGSALNTVCSMGTVGAIKEGILTAFANNANYASESGINNGYPCFEYEIKKWDGSVAEKYAGGDGLSAATAFKISNGAELAWAREQINAGTANSAYFELTADIDLNNQEWVPIGNATNAFTGKFVGNGHVVKNMKITVDATVSGNNFPRGFFGNVGTTTAGAQITNLGVDNITILVNGSGEYGPSAMGGFAGLIQGGNTKISGCYVKNSSVRALYTTAAVGSVGGFAGQVGNNVTVENCYVYNTKILGGKRTKQGGFVGNMPGAYNITLKNCYADVALDKTGQVNWSGTEAVYGFAYWASAPQAETYTTVKFTNCYSTLVDAEKDEKAAGSALNTVCSMGTVGATLATIRRLVTDGSAFKIDSAINGGFPALSFEVAPEVLDEYPYVIAAVNTNGKVKVTVLENTAVEGANVYVASYDGNGRLLNADIFSASVGTKTTNVDATGATTIKVFVWNPNQMPIANMYSK